MHVNGPATAVAGQPPDRWRLDREVLAHGDFARQAEAVFRGIAPDTALAFDIATDELVAVGTSRPTSPLLHRYSRMKHGDLAAVEHFAARLAGVALDSPRFLSLCGDARNSRRVVFITTAAVFNVPSASNLLLARTAARLNVALSRLGVSPLVVVEQTRLSDSPLGHPTDLVRDRRDDLAAGRGVTLVPEFFRGQSVIFLDDLFSTGYTVHRAEARLRRVGVADRFYLLAVRVQPSDVEASGGQVEDLVNDACLTDGLLSLVPLLNDGEYVVVQKLVKLVLDPEHGEQLPGFLAQIPTTAIRAVLDAAAGDGFRHRRDGHYRGSLLVVEQALHDRGALDDDDLRTGPGR